MFPSVICVLGSSEILCIPSERETLVKFKHHLIDPSNRLSSWNATSNANCCEWEGVVCSNLTSHVIQLHLNISPPSDYYDYDYDYEVRYEAYDRSQFGGEINPCLVDLKHLNYLDLSGNDFGGMQIPTFFGAITSLTYLNLSNAGFGGNIPYQIGNLSNLLHLDIGRNDYLSAKNLRWLLGVSKLEYLDLSYVNLSKSFDWLQVTQSLPCLVELHLTHVPLHAYYQPSTLNFSSLLTLHLSNTYSLGTSFFPQWIFGLTKLVSLQLQGNDIQGTIPNGIQNLTLLEKLDLSLNSFSFSIPDWLCGLHHLKFLYLGFNNLNGTIPDMLGNVTSLVELDLSVNQFEGKIPTSFGNLCNLRKLDLSYLKLNQQVNEIIEILTPCVSHGLECLSITDNKLSGHLTDQIGEFKTLLRLDFSNNAIHGVVPRSFGKLSSLRYLDLSNNQFNGNAFESLRSLSKLFHIIIYDNHFEGVVKEDDLANLTNLQSLIVSGNNFSLKVSPDWNPSFKLTALGLGSWNLGPKFPSWIQSQKHLRYLKMSNTGISSPIPTWFWETFSQADEFDLSHNHIQGELVNSLKNPISITSLDLSSNQLSGQLPQLSAEVIDLDLSNNLFFGPMTELLCKTDEETNNLESLNLASNNLSGKIPDCWLMWPFLAEVNLESNRFAGNLPLSMGSLAWLQSLKLRNNTLSGKFPPILKNLSKLISLDLGENKLSGNIPTWIGERFVNLKFLRLRSNKFLGHIPSQICALKFLQVMDLADNSLSGKIPNCFNHLNAMTLQNKSTYPFIYCDSVNHRELSTVSMILWLKGRNDEYRNILGLVTSIDLSNNKLSGEIPTEITNLDGLVYLNLSHNQLTGHIPQSIGNMGQLLNIDFSQNLLSGQIPLGVSNLSFLSLLNFSYNHLKGKIPTSTQLQTLEASNFVGNNLCGLPLPINCSLDGQIGNDDHNSNEDDEHKVNWFFVSMALGFVVGFWIVVAPLFIYKSWRYVYFRFLDNVWFKLECFLVK
ncbi:hypothetical protein VNO77_33578 [Canavalia gladiata]|uniref:Leucine-rich repeat-containing N-terminal plant-type domain-containing protein n=1 Tax=Canavalia gladiata TaxID=3824 RepID=A0AAN9KE20_CANGL